MKLAAPMAIALSCLWVGAACGGVVPIPRPPRLPGLAQIAPTGTLLNAHAELTVSIGTLQSVAEPAQRHAVKLSDLGADMAVYQGKSQTDFLKNATDPQGRRIAFTYVSIGSPQYDAFAKSVIVSKALTYQTLQTLNRMAVLSGEILGEKVVLNAVLRDNVTRALLKRRGDKAKQAELQKLRSLGKSLAVLVPRFRRQVTALRIQGQGLVNGSSSLAMSVNMVAHADVVAQSVVQGLASVEETFAWSAQALPWLVAFGRANGGKHPTLDKNGDRLDRAELAALLFDAEP